MFPTVFFILVNHLQTVIVDILFINQEDIHGSAVLTGRKRSKKTSNSFEFTSYWADGNNRTIPDLVDFTKTFFDDTGSAVFQLFLQNSSTFVPVGSSFFKAIDLLEHQSSL